MRPIRLWIACLCFPQIHVMKAQPLCEETMAVVVCIVKGLEYLLELY